MRLGTTTIVVFLGLSLLLMSGCRTSRNCDSDGNGEASKAMLLTDLVKVKDKVGGRCDDTDWRYISHHSPATARLTLHVGDAFKGHKLKGDLGLYDKDANIIDQREIRPGQTKYEVTLPVDAKQDYYVRVRSNSGASTYELSTQFDERDPCASCPPRSRCQNGQCVDVAAERDPCGGRCVAGFECDFNTLQCVSSPCGGACPPGQFCDEDRNQCVQDDEPECRRNSDCPRGERCKRQMCVAKKESKPQCGGNDDCSRGKICKKGRCVTKPQCASSSDCSGDAVCKKGKCVKDKSEASSGPVSGKIVSIQDGAKGTMLTISVPSGHTIKRGASGKVVGLPSGGFVITKVAGSRVQGRMTRIKSRDGVGNKRKVTIQP